ncbi:hypothetical protein [Krasilnikovia sp. MM14-A1259]|uniref:hypothetical protein n=1 Tax=Krasilnikovia sp. MM14-A1259 TaxID=3373539 RepID=UPI00399C89A5
MTSLAWRRATRAHRPLVVFAGLMGIAAVVAVIGIVADPRVLTGVPIWLKPFKFAVSFGAYSLTLAWMLSLLPRRSRLAERAATVIVAMAAIEMVVIIGQVVRGQTSHYNQTTPLNAALWQAMGTAIMVLFAAQFVVTVVLARRPLGDRVATYGIRLGLGLSLLGLAAAIPMVLPSAAPGTPGIAGAHSVGVPDGGPGLPLVGWSTVGGDLRIGHFVGLHALQVMPLLALLLGRFASRLDSAVRARLMLVAGAAYGALTVLLTWQALRGQPLLRPDALTVAAFGVLAVMTVAAATGVVRAGSAARAAAPRAHLGGTA